MARVEGEGEGEQGRLASGREGPGGRRRARSTRGPGGAGARAAGSCPPAGFPAGGPRGAPRTSHGVRPTR